jgi:hypothetical protein
MAGCYFRATGDEFDVDSFLIGSSLDVDGVYHKGEPIGRRGKVHQFTGFSVGVSEHFRNLKKQIPHVIAFLRENERELGRLAEYPGVTELLLAFSYERRAGLVIQSDKLPPELLKLAGGLGITIELTLYPDDEEWEKAFRH